MDWKCKPFTLCGKMLQWRLLPSVRLCNMKKSEAMLN